jgi:hypothetical protein
MDFIMTFVVYLFALSVFMFSLRNTFLSSAGLDVQGELLFSKIDNINDEEFDFLDGSRIDSAKLTNFITKDPREVYNLFFKDFENPSIYKRTDYCMYLEDDSEMIVNYAAWDEDLFSQNIVIVERDSPSICGNNKHNPYNNTYCSESVKADSLVLTKPVLYERNIVNFKVLICAERK